MHATKDAAAILEANLIDLNDDIEKLRLPRKRSLKQAQQPSTRLTRPKSIEEIVRILSDEHKYPSPVRPRGSGSSATRCAETTSGTIVDMTGMNRIIAVEKDTVTVQAGIKLRDLAENLAMGGMELVNGCAEPERTVGGAISSGTLGVGLPGQGVHIAASVVHMGMVRSDGQRVEINDRLPDLLRLARQSYGLLGIIHTVKLKIQPIQAYEIKSQKFDFDGFAQTVDNLSGSSGAMRASLMPFRNRVNAELRCPAKTSTNAAVLRWKLRNWAAESVLPSMVRSVNKMLPIGTLRDPLIDGVTSATQALMGSTLTDAGSHAAEQTGRFRVLTHPDDIVSTVWFFPADNFCSVIAEFRRFCLGHYKAHKFRCDLPTELWGFDRDRCALLSPSFDGGVFALDVRSTRREGWDNFVFEFAEFAGCYGAVPSFNQSRGLTASLAARAYGARLQQFRVLRVRFDPENRLLNQFFAEHIG